MKKQEYQALIEKTAEDARTFRELFSQIKEYLERIEKAKLELEGTSEQSGLLSQVNKFLKELEEKSGRISSVYKEVCEDTSEKKSLKTQLENILSSINTEYDQAKDFSKSFFGYEKTNENGQSERIEGTSKKIDIFFNEQQKKYDSFYRKIEQELEAGTTSLNLSKSFADKVKEYSNSALVWAILFIGVLCTTVVYGYNLVIKEAQNIHTIEDVWRLLILNGPLIAFVVWLGAFLANRRAENKKLEEAYKHKEVMARSFVGYRQALGEIGDEDRALLKKHMDNLLNSIGDNSSEFLSTDGERHPFVELLASIALPKRSKPEDPKI